MAAWASPMTNLLTFYLCISVFTTTIGSERNVPNLTTRLPTGVNDDCQALLKSFAETVGLFTFCAINHARPIRLCEQCIQFYLDVTAVHDQILQLEDTSGNTCKPELINLDRLEIIESTFNNVGDLWTRGNCNNCFSFVDGKLTVELNNKTKTFQDLNKQNEACFAQFNVSGEALASNVCTGCKDEYCKMNEHYNTMKEDSSDICIDVVDSMNSTRLKWSQTYGCSLNIMHLDISLIVAICIVTLTPIIFYAAAKVYSVKTETKLLQQNRLAEHLGNPEAARRSQPFATPSTSRRAS